MWEHDAAGIGISHLNSNYIGWQRVLTRESNIADSRLGIIEIQLPRAGISGRMCYQRGELVQVEKGIVVSSGELVGWLTNVVSSKRI